MTPRVVPAAFVLALAAAASPARAPADTLTGTVVEPPARTPLGGAEVVVRRTADSTVAGHTTTGTDGRFRIADLAPGRYRLRASLLGHVALVRPEVVLADSAGVTDLGVLALAVDPVAVGGVSVSSERATAIVAPDRNIYLTRDMPAATSGTAIDVLRTVPELDVDVDGRISLRGSAGVNLKFNGRDAPMKGDALATYLRQFPASRIERIEVIANPSAKFDPEGAAGIVNLVLKDNVDLGLSGSVSASAGSSYSGPGARVAWQKGRLTLFGGLSGSFGRGSYATDVTRRDLLAVPVSTYLSANASDYRSAYGTSDLSVDWALSKRVTLYGALNGYLNGSDTDARLSSTLSDSVAGVTSRFDRADAMHASGRTGYLTLGVQHVVRQGRDERSLEFSSSDTRYGSDDDGLQHTFVPAGSEDQASGQSTAYGYRQRTLELDDTHPLGSKGKLEMGYEGNVRSNTNSSVLAFFSGGSLVVLPLSGSGDYEHRERIHSGYLTASSTFGRFSLQLGARGEFANSNFVVRSSGGRYVHDYRSLYPSSNAAWDFGGGRTARLTFSRRVERPAAWYLNPDVPSADPLNRSAGNPYLAPKYTNSLSLDASWAGSRGMLQLSPYWRETTGNWDQVTQVDASGHATTTWQNASSVRFLGASVTASLRQVHRLGGSLNASVYREHHDAGNLSSQFRRDATAWSANANASIKTTATLDLQGYLRYSPAQTLAQGRASAYTFTYVGARQKFGSRAWANVTVRDPFNLAHTSRRTGDATYEASSRSHNSVRGLSGTLTWTWGRPPEQQPRRTGGDVPPPDAPPRP